MRKRHLTIDKFGPVEHAEIVIKKINLFIGQQSVGKSTVAKLITILTDEINLIRLLTGGHPAWISLLEEYNLNGYLLNQNYKIEYQVLEDKFDLHLLVDKSRLQKTFKLNGEVVDDIERITTTIFQAKTFLHREEFLRQFLDLKKIKPQNVVELIKGSLYIPAERNIVSVINKIQAILLLSESALPKPLLRFMVELNNARDYCSKREIPLLNISYVWDQGEDYFVIGGRKQQLPLRIASSGIQSLLPLYIVLVYSLDKREYSSYVIEEPECNLFPDKQVDLLKFLLSSMRDDRLTLTITTHSPYLLSAMNNYLFAGHLLKETPGLTKDDIETATNDDIPILDSDNCSVYSLGKDINGGGYCKSLINEEIGMIDTNNLDGVSVRLGEQFERIDQLLFNESK